MSSLKDILLELRVTVLAELLKREGIYQSKEFIRSAADGHSNSDVMREFRLLRRQAPWWATIFRPREREIVRKLEAGSDAAAGDAWPRQPPIH